MPAAAARTHLWHLLLATHLCLLAVTSNDAAQVVFDINFRDWCTQRCPYQNQTEDGAVDVGCGNECKIKQCSRGCELWQRALESSCQTVCNGTQELLPPKELYCIIGCNDAVNRYFQRLKEEIGVPAAPALVADTLTATSLRLEWEGSRYSNISYLVQWRFEELAGAWHYCRNQTWGPHSTVFVDNLQPYTKYRFRIALLLSLHHGEPIVSQPSVVISTLSSGLPSSPPTIVRATADIAASENKDHYMFKNLLARRNYTLSVAMRNGVGEGPASTILVSTPPEPIIRDAQQQPVLILGAHHTVIRQVADMMEEPVVMYNTTQQIRGVAIHVSRHLLFVSDSAGYVHRTSLQRYTSPLTILTPQHASFAPLALSVDWLNDQLYVLGEVAHAAGPRWQVARCGLDGRGLTVAVAGLFARPHHIEVDPYNGYLFWAVSGPRGGLYRLDMADISNGVKHDIMPELILDEPNLGSFVVDHTNFRLLVPHQNTVIAVSLDGHEKLDLRKNTQKPMFHNVTSIAQANGLFYWTNGREIYTEEYHPGQDSYFHNGYPDLSNRSFVSVSVNLPSSQPMPIPVNPPTGVQAILGAELAKASWQVPHLLGGQGKGAWQNWSYELHIKDETRGMTIFSKGINTTAYTIQNLMENTEYVIKTAAYTSAGKGPWSSEFRGKTLRFPKDGHYASILWSASEGLLKSDVTGESVETLIHVSSLQGYHITDIAWYHDRLYLVTNTTHVDWFNTTSHERGTLTEIDSVGSIAVDWIGKKLYWSNPKQQLITRGSLNGTQQEPLPILTVAKELNVDSVQAYIYWSTGHAVESARLNGEDRRTYYPAELFSGKQVMGLTLDSDQRAVYWIVRSYEGSKLFRASTAELVKPGSEIELLGVPSLQTTDMQGPLCYFSDHLLWLQDNRNAVIGDLGGQNAAVISGMSLSGLNMVAIMDPAIQQVFNSSFLREINVIPDSVSQQSISVVGTHKSFKVVWRPVTNTNYGQLFYDVKIDNSHKHQVQQLVTTEPFVSYWNPYSLTPYSPLHVTVKAFTYWGVSAGVRATLHSPPSVPSAPTHTRVFVSHVRSPVKDGAEIKAVLRWDPPAKPNGVVKGYKVKCWFTISENELTVCDSYDMNDEKLEFTAYNLLGNSTYYFQVQAFTEVGSGVLTSPIRADTDVEMPVPQLLLSTSDAVTIADCDKRDNQTLSSGAGPPVDLAYISQENKVFWLSEMRELFSADTDGRQRTKVTTLNHTGLSIAVDWVGRYIYWSEMEGRGGGGGSAIYRLDLNQADKGTVQATEVLKRDKAVVSLEVSPYKSMLYWVEANQNEVGNLMTGRTDGTQIKPFFMKHKPRPRRHSSPARPACNCPDNPAVGPAMSMDRSRPPQLLWVDGYAGHVWASDMAGCRCTLLVNASLATDSGLPPSSLTSDQRLVYWSNATTGRVYSVTKAGGGDPAMASLVRGVTARDMSGVRGIAALGSHLQPYPERRCLSPHQFPTAVSLASRTSHSITLRLPDAFRYGGCENVSLATVEYAVHYGPLRDDDNGTAGCISDLANCTTINTFDQRLEIAGLKPFTRYVFFVGLKNYYSDMEGVVATVGPPIVFPTDAGAPSRPLNVSVRAVNPTTLLVRWQPPVELNDASVRYHLHWATDGPLRQTGEQEVPDPDALTALVHDLLPGRAYAVSVRAYSLHNRAAPHNESRPVRAQTYPEPGAIDVVSATASTLNVTWMPSAQHGVESQTVQCREVGAREWHAQALTANRDGEFAYALGNLLPKTKYTFRLALVYKLSAEPYVWPQDERFTFETLGDCPSPPGTPIIQHVRRDVYQLSWEASRENGAPIELYSLEGLVVGGRRGKREANYTGEAPAEATAPATAEEEEWTTYHNGTDGYWIVKELGARLEYVFRVRSRNSYGWSQYGGTSEVFDVSAAAVLAGQGEVGVWLATAMAVLFSVTIAVTAVVSYYMCMFTRRKQDKKALQGGTSTVRGPDVELATLRELPRRGNFVHNTNALYTTSDSHVPTDEEIALLPHIRRDQITLTKFLGSGAFGEVFEGVARGLGAVESRVAVKTLRKGATDQEKVEFLKEAQLMSNFKHEHILQLLGVCLDNDPRFIIMELMPSGDLLSYLRLSRPLLYSATALTLLDLLAMCVDVARGCRYLEEMHFVHRDLACRNCLVSSDDPATRRVKIGDFGLARDIYKNDYYRKEGEGLLPVRWMSPESLVDGVFTCQSDVWACGVLVWEILTLGQQPYPARTNLEVLHYVRNGGRLGRPSNCPEELHQLMLKCWSYSPENRPTFKYCLDVLVGLKSKTTAVPLTAVHIGHYVSRTRSGSSWKTESEGGSRDRVPFLPPGPDPSPRSPTAGGDVPRYLELIYDDSDSATTVSDGYEIPRTSRATGDDDRPRTFSTSSTLSDVSASTNQTSPPACGRVEEEAELHSSTGGKGGSLRRTPAAAEVGRSSDKDLASLEQLLPTLKAGNGQTFSVGLANDRNKKPVMSYTNVANQPLLETTILNDSISTESVCAAGVMTQVNESNAQNQTIS